MSDFPAFLALPDPLINLHPWSPVGPMPGQNVAVIPASGAWHANNAAMFYPIRLSRPYLVSQLWWINGATASGNVDCGIYSADGTRLISTGSTAQSGTSVEQIVDVADTWIGPGRFYIALAASTTAATFFGTTAGVFNAVALGMAQQTASAFPLPATVTMIRTTGNTRVAVCGATPRAFL